MFVYIYLRSKLNELCLLKAYIDFFWSSGQDRGIGRHPLLPHTPKRRMTTNLKSINNQKCQNIKLHETLTTKELKKKSTRITRPVRQWTRRADSEKLGAGGGSWGWGWPLRGSLLQGRSRLTGRLRLRADCGLRQLWQ